ncbi:MAG: hypothetical protein ILA06_09665 [Bacteroidaceae bacterium]|nr:hypothetical protein [Bacteroidaceae bacterium]
MIYKVTTYIRQLSVFIVLSMLTLTSVWAQDIDIMVTPKQQILPPQVGGYLESPDKFFTVTITNNTAETQNIYIGLQLEQLMPERELAVSTPAMRYPNTAIIVPPGQPKTLTLVEMRNLFNDLTLSQIYVRKGLYAETKNGIMGLLPEGDYLVRLTAYKYDLTLTDAYPISNPNSGTGAFKVCYSAQAPTILTPTYMVTGKALGTGRTQSSTVKTAEDALALTKGKTLTATTTTTPLSLSQKGTALGAAIDRQSTFGSITASDLNDDFNVATLNINDPRIAWTRPTLACNQSLAIFSYALKIVEVGAGQSADYAMDTNPAFYETMSDLRTNMFTVPASVLKQFRPDALYAVQVTAHTGAQNAEGSLNYVLVNNDGKSTLKLFRVVSDVVQEETIMKEEVVDEESADEETADKDGRSGSSMSSGGKDYDADSLYVFKNPTITRPIFIEGTTRKVFVGEDIVPEWRKIWHMGGRGERQDTIKAEYTVQLFKANPRDPRSTIFQQKPIYTKDVKDKLKDSIEWKKLDGKVYKGDYLVMRIVPKVTNEKSIRFEDDSTNVMDFALTERLSDKLQCTPGEGVTTNLVLAETAPKKGDKVGIGAYDMIIEECQLDNEKKAFKGKGHVVWAPAGFDILVAVKFDSLAINSNNLVYAGKVITYPENEDKMQSTNSDVIDALFSDLGIDTWITDLGIPYADDIQQAVNTDGKEELKNLSQSLDLHTYYDYIKSARVIWDDLKKGSVRCHLPLQLPKDINPTPVDIQIATMTFTSTYAQMSIIGEAALPASNTYKNEILLFGAPRLCISPDELLPQDGALCLLDDFTFTDKDSGFELSFNKPTDVTDPVNGCYVSWMDGDFSELLVDIDMRIPKNLAKRVEKDKVIDESPVLNLKGRMNSFEDWTLEGTMHSFEAVDLPGWTFSPGQVSYDHHSKLAINGFEASLPKKYKLDKSVDGKPAFADASDWRGLWVHDMRVKFPKIIEAENKKDEGRVIGSLDNFFIDATGVSCDAKVIFENVIASTGGWSISIDDAYIHVVQSTFDRAGFEGQFTVPMLKSTKKDKDGKHEEAHIKYQAELSLQDQGAEAERHRVWLFKTSEQDDMSLDFWLAKATFDKDQTYFLVEAEEDEETRVELCLGGEIEINSGFTSEVNAKTSKIGLKIPGVAFANMRLANCERWQSKVDAKQAAQYKKWKDQAGKGGKEDGKTFYTMEKELVSSDGKIHFDLGRWSFASPQKKIGGFLFTLSDFGIDESGSQIGLRIGGDISMLNGKLSGGTTATVWAEADWDKKEVNYRGLEFKEAHIKSKGLGGIDISGTLEIDYGQDESGNREAKGFRAELDMKMPGDLFAFHAAGAYSEATKPADVLADEQRKWQASLDERIQSLTEQGKMDEVAELQANSQFNPDETYTWAFLEITVDLGQGVGVDPVKVKRVGGGFYFNCYKDLGSTIGKETAKPSYGMVGGMFDIGLVIGQEKAMNASGDLYVFYDMYKDRLSTLRIKADFHAICGKSDKGLINANITILYKEDDKDHYFDADITVDAKADMTEELAQFTGLAEDVLKSASEAGLGEMGVQDDDENKNSNSSEGAESAKEKEEEAKAHLSAGVYININLRVTWKKDGQKLDDPKWHLYIGQPDEDKRCKITFIDFALGKRSDSFAMWATVYADAYLCFGNELPCDELPPIPSEIQEYLGGTDISGKPQALGAEAESERQNVVKTFSGFGGGPGNNGGFMFGAKAYGDFGINAGLVYARATLILGFDLMIKKLKEGTTCIGGREAGKNGWYGTGQVYALFKGEVGLDINLWIWKGKVPLIDVGLGALLKGGMPNPTWVYGKVKAHCKLLGGLVKFNHSVELKAGEVCVPEFGNPLDDIKLFDDAQPGTEDREESWNEKRAYGMNTEPRFTTSMDIDKHIRLVDKNVAYEHAGWDEDISIYNEQASRTYVFHLDPQMMLDIYDVSKEKNENAMPDTTEMVTYWTKDRSSYLLNTQLKRNKLYRMTLSGYCKEIRDGREVDPIFNDSLSDHKDEHRAWRDSMIVYFRTDNKLPSIGDDIAVLYLDYKEDAKQPTMAMRHSHEEETVNPSRKLMGRLQYYDEQARAWLPVDVTYYKVEEQGDPGRPYQPAQHIPNMTIIERGEPCGNGLHGLEQQVFDDTWKDRIQETIDKGEISAGTLSDALDAKAGSKGDPLGVLDTGGGYELTNTGTTTNPSNVFVHGTDDFGLTGSKGTIVTGSNTNIITAGNPIDATIIENVKVDASVKTNAVMQQAGTTLRMTSLRGGPSPEMEHYYAPDTVATAARRTTLGTTTATTSASRLRVATDTLSTGVRGVSGLTGGTVTRTPVVESSTTTTTAADDLRVASAGSKTRLSTSNDEVEEMNLATLVAISKNPSITVTQGGDATAGQPVIGSKEDLMTAKVSESVSKMPEIHFGKGVGNVGDYCIYCDGFNWVTARIDSFTDIPEQQAIPASADYVPPHWTYSSDPSKSDYQNMELETIQPKGTDYIFMRTVKSFDNLDPKKYYRFQLNYINFDGLNSFCDDFIEKYKNTVSQAKNPENTTVTAVVTDGTDAAPDQPSAEPAVDVDKYLNDYYEALNNELKGDTTSIRVREFAQQLAFNDFTETAFEILFRIDPNYDSFRQQAQKEISESGRPKLTIGTYSYGYNTTWGWYLDCWYGLQQEFKNMKKTTAPLSILKNISYKQSLPSLSQSIVSGKSYLKDPYLNLGYWATWAFVDGYSGVGYGFCNKSNAPYIYKGLDVNFDVTGLRSNDEYAPAAIRSHYEWTATSPTVSTGSEITKFSNEIKPSMYEQYEPGFKFVSGFSRGTLWPVEYLYGQDANFIVKAFYPRLQKVFNDFLSYTGANNPSKRFTAIANAKSWSSTYANSVISFNSNADHISGVDLSRRWNFSFSVPYYQIPLLALHYMQPGWYLMDGTYKSSKPSSALPSQQFSWPVSLPQWRFTADCAKAVMESVNATPTLKQLTDNVRSFNYYFFRQDAYHTEGHPASKALDVYNSNKNLIEYQVTPKFDDSNNYYSDSYYNY